MPDGKFENNRGQRTTDASNSSYDKKYLITSTPHIRAPITTNKIMLTVLAALAPAGFVGFWHFGIRSVLVTALCIICCVGFEALYQKFTRQNITINDFSAVVTGLLLAYNLPPGVSFYIPVVGSFVAIVIIKQLFGGLGQNFMNPALGARAFLVASYMPQMVGNFTEPADNVLGFDLVATATPLYQAAQEGFIPFAEGTPSLFTLLLGAHGGTIGETCAIALIIGGLFLIFTRIITWHVPVTFIGTSFLMMFLLQPGEMTLSYPVFQMLSGGLMLGAFFMATDYASSPVTPKGKIIMGVGCGLLTAFIRSYSDYPEGVSYAILLMNLAVPLIERFTKPRVYGVKRFKASQE